CAYPAACPSCLPQLPVLVRAQVERAEPRARSFRPRETDHDEVIGPVRPNLEPVGGTAGTIGSLGLFRDDPLEPHLHDLLVQRLTVLLAVREILDRTHAGHDRLAPGRG